MINFIKYFCSLNFFLVFINSFCIARRCPQSFFRRRSVRGCRVCCSSLFRFPSVKSRRSLYSPNAVVGTVPCNILSRRRPTSASTCWRIALAERCPKRALSRNPARSVVQLLQVCFVYFSGTPMDSKYFTFGLVSGFHAL